MLAKLIDENNVQELEQFTNMMIDGNFVINADLILNENTELANAHGFYELIKTEKTTEESTAHYELVNNQIIQSWVNNT